MEILHLIFTYDNIYQATSVIWKIIVDIILKSQTSPWQILDRYLFRKVYYKNFVSWINFVFSLVLVYGVQHHFQQYFRFNGGQFYCRRKPELSQVTDKLYHKCCIEYTSPWRGFELTTLVVIGTDCNATMAPFLHFNLMIYLEYLTNQQNLQSIVSIYKICVVLIFNFLKKMCFITIV